MKNEALPVDVSLLTPEQKAALLTSLQKEQTEANNKRRDAYEGLRKDYVKRICERVLAMEGNVLELHKFVTDESMAFFEVMKEYGQLRREGQLSYQVTEEDFRIEVKTNKVKKFDERADVAATRLMEFLEKWIEDSEKGTSDPMYQLGMTLLERNQQGDLDYKSISKLYQLESDFNDTEYSAIMQLFKESNIVEGTATNFYFSRKDEREVWRKVEISFNRL